jgi:hypothetical protein
MLGEILDMQLDGASICTAELRIPAALRSNVSLVIEFLAILQSMIPASW